MKNIDMSKVFASARTEQPLRLVCDYIDADKLKVHPENEKIYGKLDVKDLISEITRAGGVKEPVETVKKGDDLYLIAGHRRRQATLMAYEKGLIKSKKIPYIISKFKNEDEELLALIGRNTQRHKTAQIRQNEIREITNLLKKNKSNIKGSFRAYVADYLGISETDLQRYWDYEKLADCVKKAVEDKKLTFSAACEFASLNQKEQEFVFAELQKKNHLMVKNIRQAKKAIKNSEHVEKESDNTTVPEDKKENFFETVDTLKTENSPMPEGYSNEDVSSEKPIKVPDKPAVAVQKDTQNKILANKDNLNASAVKFCISFLQARRDELEEKEIPDNEELTVIAYQDYLDKLISMLKKALKDMK